jgi:hypothetical protein
VQPTLVCRTFIQRGLFPEIHTWGYGVQRGTWVMGFDKRILRQVLNRLIYTHAMKHKVLHPGVILSKNHGTP